MDSIETQKILGSENPIPVSGVGDGLALFLRRRHEMEILDSSGHTRTTWDSDKEDEVAAARAQFETLTKKGYKAFRVTRLGGEGEPMKSFDPDAEKMILVPPVQGG